MFAVDLILLLVGGFIYLSVAGAIFFNLYFELIRGDSSWLDFVAIALVALLWPVLSMIVTVVYAMHRFGERRQ